MVEFKTMFLSCHEEVQSDRTVRCAFLVPFFNMKTLSAGNINISAVHWRRSVISIYEASMGSASEATNTGVYFHHRSGTPGTTPAAVEGKEITPVVLDSSVGKWAPLVRTSGKDLPVSHHLLVWEPWLAVRKAQQYPKSHQLRIKQTGGSVWACNYSTERLTFNESTSTMRKHFKDNGAEGSPSKGTTETNEVPANILANTEHQTWFNLG